MKGLLQWEYEVEYWNEFKRAVNQHNRMKYTEYFGIFELTFQESKSILVRMKHSN